MDDQLTMHAALGTDGDELLTIDRDLKSGRCTAACLDARQNLRREILNALAENLGTRRVAKAFGVSREVVRALYRVALESGELDHHKQRLGRDAFSLASATIDRIADEIDDMPKSSLAIIAGIMIDKGQLLTGGVTSRIAHGEAPADINALLDGLPSANVIDLVAPVDSGENSPQKAGDVLEIGDGLDQTGDLQSPVSSPSPEVTTVDKVGNGQTAQRKEGEV